MSELAIITPSRGRPRQFAEFARAVHDLSTGSPEIWVGRDNDDATDYLTELRELDGTGYAIHAFSGDRLSLSGWTNLLADRALGSQNPPEFLASLGDDHRPRTRGWDARLIDAIKGLGGSGIAYGNDLLQGERLPTAWVMSADIVRTLGWMMLPVCKHMCVDDAILRLGRELGLIVYRPDAIVEHLHPTAGKAAFDDSYRASNHPSVYAADRRAFDEWCSGGGLARAVELVHADLSVSQRR